MGLAVRFVSPLIATAGTLLALGCCGLPGAGVIAPKAAPAAPQGLGFLCDMQELDARVGYGRFGKFGMLGYSLRFGEAESQISVAGKTYPHALSVHPPSFGSSSASYSLGRQARSLHGWVGLNDILPGDPPVATASTFKILGDDKVLWTSQPNQIAGTAEEFTVGVQGVDVLQLQAHCNGENTCARAVWLEPKVTK
jgi:hypothetical protein